MPLSKDAKSGAEAANSSPAPLDNLYIYYLEGRIPPECTDTAEHFLGNWEEDGFSFLFFSEPSDTFIQQKIASLPDVTLLDQYEMRYDQWHGDTVTTFRVKPFRVVPPWETDVSGPKSPDDIEIILDPGLVFGTGLHPTTNDCLEALISLWYDDEIESVIDLGTGTGLLAIAAAKLGCRTGLAVDFNHLAAKTARQNVIYNHLEEKILVVQGLAEEMMDKPADLMISNIHYNVMRHLVNLQSFLQYRYFILSGLLRSEARTISEKLQRLPVEVLQTWDRNGVWHTFLGKSANL